MNTFPRAAAASVAATLLTLFLSACAAGPSTPVESSPVAAPTSATPTATPTPSSSASITAAPSSSAVTSTPTPTSSPIPTSTPTATPNPTPASPTCSGDNATTAMDAAISGGLVRDGMYEWDLEHLYTQDYDDCASLSAIIYPVKGATGSSPYQIQLFHLGRPLGPATEADYGFWPAIERLDDDALSVTYTYGLPGETTVGASGKAVSEFRWDESSEAVVRSGEVPPGYDVAEKPVGQPEAGSDTEAEGPASDLPPVDIFGGEQGILFTSPTGNIVCDMIVEATTCYVTEVHAGVARTLPEEAGMPAGKLRLTTGMVLPDGTVEHARRDDTLIAMNLPSRTLEYGEIARYGGVTCASEFDGMTCTHDATGHAMHLSRNGVDLHAGR